MEQLANRIAVFFMQKKLITAEETPIYSYCFEAVLSMVVSWGSILVIAMLTNTLWVTACYIGSFCLLRSVVGGYHASTHLSCYMLSVGAYLLFLLVQFSLPTQYVSIICCLLAVFSVAVLLKLAPLEHPNNPFTPQSYQQFHRRMLLFLVLFIIILPMLLQHTLWQTAFASTWGCTQAATSVAVAHYFSEKEERTL